MKICPLIILGIALLFYTMDILSLIFSIWITIAIKVLFCIYFAFLSMYYIFIFLYEIPLNFDILQKLRRKTEKFHPMIVIIVALLNFIGFILLSVNSSKSTNFWSNCPYLMSDLDYSKHYKKRCELYHINNNSRYSYQYICSYDSSKEFKRQKLIQEIKPNSVICIEANNINNLINNKVIELFTNEYKNNKNFFCSRTNMPEDNFTFAKHKDCNNSKYSLMIVFIFFSIFEFLNTLIYLNLSMYASEYERRRRIERIPRLGVRDSLNSNERRFYEIHQLINLSRLLNLMRDLIIMNNVSPSNCSTEASENQGGNNGNMEENFERKNTTNIVVENQGVFDVETNIENFSPDKKNNNINNINDKKSISLENINLDFNVNSEENKINNIDNIDNINKNIINNH